MPAKKKTKEDAKIEDPKDAEESVGDEAKAEEKAPKYVTVEKEKEDDDVAETKIEHEGPLAEKEEESPSKEETPVIPITGIDKPSSFSLLDADKTESKPAETEIKEPVTVSEPEVETKEEPPVTATAEESKSSTQSDSDWLKDTPTETVASSDEGEKKGISKKIIIFVVMLIVVAGIVAGGVYYYKSNVQVESESTVEQAETPTPLPTEVVEEEAMEEEIDASEYSVSVLNGSGIPGEAGKVEDLLTGAGFEGIETGNADSYDFLETRVSVKVDAPKGVYKAIKAALGSDYKVVLSEDALDEDSSFDVIIIAGSEGPEEAEETPTPTPAEE